MKDNPLTRWWRSRSRDSATTAPPAGSPAATEVSGVPLQAEVIHPEDYVGSDASKNEEVVREGFLDKARRYLKYLPMAEEVVAAYFCMLDGKTPIWVKGTVAAALAYFILPLDAIPDMLPIVGLNDDAAVITAALTAIAAYVTDDHRRRAREFLRIEHIATADAKPQAAAGRS